MTSCSSAQGDDISADLLGGETASIDLPGFAFVGHVALGNGRVAAVEPEGVTIERRDILELGSAWGLSTTILCRAAANAGRGSKVWSVELDPELWVLSEKTSIREMK